VTALVDVFSGHVVERYVYNPYGETEKVYSDNWTTEVAWSASKKNNVRYCGYFFDNETGLYSVRHRTYHPTLGRWLSRDPIGYADCMSFYLYVAARPVSSLDPSGLGARPRPVEMEPGLGEVVIPVLGDIAEGLWNTAQAGIVESLSEQPNLPPPRTGDEFASVEYCCLCVDLAIHHRMYVSERASAYMDKVTDPNVRTAKGLEEAVHGEGGVMGPGLITGETSPFGSKVYPQGGPCGELLTQAAAEHERSHWEDRNYLLTLSSSGIRGILSVWPSAWGGGDKYFWALSEAGACDAEERFLEEFIRACEELGVGD